MTKALPSLLLALFLPTVVLPDHDAVGSLLLEKELSADFDPPGTFRNT